MQRPKGRLLLFWGCGETARAGQPVIIDFARVAQGQMPTPDFLAARIDDVLTGLVEWRFSGARSETALKRFAPALREYSAAQLKAIQSSRQQPPPPPSSDKPSDGVGKMVPAWDPRKMR